MLPTILYSSPSGSTGSCLSTFGGIVVTVALAGYFALTLMGMPVAASSDMISFVSTLSFPLNSGLMSFLRRPRTAGVNTSPGFASFRID